MSTFELDQIKRIHERIIAACQRAGRNAGEVTLVGASKTVEAGRLQTFFDAGLKNFGENYVQEGTEKVAFFGQHCLKAHWHFIGALQSNKAREAVRDFELVHSVDRLSLARELNKEARKADCVQRVLIQVNVGEEDSKSGIAPDGVGELLEACANLQNLRVEGLMSLPPFDEDAEKTRPYHTQLRELRDKLATAERPLPVLSMGMSRDFEVAIEEGATMVRVGTALFGARR